MFDNTGLLISDAEISRSDKIEMFRKRREDAVALWATIPDEDFNISNWECGTTRCAIGWLAALNFDGWKMHIGGNFPSRGINESGMPSSIFNEVADYFGLSRGMATQMFGGDGVIYFYNTFISFITLKGVSAKLLEAEYET